MKFNVNQKDLQSSLKYCQGVIEKRSTLPILSNVLLEAKDANLKIMSAPCDIAGSHWWLEDNDKIIDITADQYFNVNKTPPYDKGKKSNWYGWKNRPHRKSQNLMHEVQPSSTLEFKKYLEKPKQSY